jgi:L-threonylcarbamoyladenylate synthase
VYGLSADGENDRAVAKIFSLKSRPLFNPLIVHVGSIEIAQRYGEWNARAELLARAFWPGALTLVLTLKQNTKISDLVTCGGNTVALRMPNHPLSLPLLARFGRGVAAPSANRSGCVSPTTAEHVRDEFGTDCPPILDGGASKVGLESTVLDISGDTAVLLRPGAITFEMISKVLGDYPLISHEDKPVERGLLRAPGQLASHYAPSLPVRLNATSVGADEALLAYGNAPLAGAAKTINLSQSGNLEEAASNLFASMRALDNVCYRAIAVMPIPNQGIGHAINDRLTRASVRPEA